MRSRILAFRPPRNVRPRRVAAALALWIAFSSGVAAAQEDTSDSGATEPQSREQSEQQPDADAQEADEDFPPGVEVIHVQGRGVTAIETDVSSSITQFDAAALQAIGAQNVSDIARVTPNLEIKTAGATAPTFFIRGVGLNDFSSNGSGAVAIYQDDVPRNAPAIQLGQFFDLENVEVLKGPQGGGSGRNASAGAIRVVSRKPTGELDAFLRSSFGNYNLRDFEGAIETPLVDEILSSRLAFRFAERDGIAENRCARIPDRTTSGPNSGLPHIPATSAANALGEQRVPPLDERVNEALTQPGPRSNSAWDRVSFCGENIYTSYIVDPDALPPTTAQFPSFPGPPTDRGLRSLSALPGGLPEEINDLGSWSARGTLRLQPAGTDMDWLINGHGSRLDQLSTLGESVGTRNNVFGASTALPYRNQDVVTVRDSFTAKGYSGTALNEVTAQHLAEVGDRDPYKGDYNRVGDTTLDTWGGYVHGDWALGDVTLTSITGYDTYDRFRDTDQDFTPDVLFESVIEDDAWQATQELKAGGELVDLPLRWELGAFTLTEDLDQDQLQLARGAQSALVSDKLSLLFNQKLWSWAAFAGFSYDLFEDFTLDGGVRYNWERKSFETAFDQLHNTQPVRLTADTETWQAPTGTVSLAYRFREDVSTYWKYSRGWKGGHFSALPQLNKGVTVADPESIDAYEVGVKGAWFDGRLNLGLALFYYAYENYQVLTVEDSVAGPPGIAIINAEDAEVYGSEIEMRAEPLDALVFTGRFSWLESQYLDFTNEIVQTVPGSVPNTTKDLVVTVDYTGNQLINSPNLKFSGVVEYTLDIGRYGALLPRFDFSWSDDIFFDPTEGRGSPNAVGEVFLPEFATGQPAFWLMNFRMGYRTADGTLELGGWVRNLTDQTYKTYGFDASQFSDVVINYYGEPRTYGLDFTVNF